MLHSLGLEAGSRLFSLPEEPISKRRRDRQAKLGVRLVVAQFGDEGDYPGRHYVALRRSDNGPRKRPTQEEMATTMARVPGKYKKRHVKEGEEVWSPREVVGRVLALNHWDDIDGVLNCWLGRFNRKNFPALISVLSRMPTFYFLASTLPICLHFFSVRRL